MCRDKQDFKKSQRLKQRNLFSSLFKKGKHFKGIDFSVRLLNNNLTITRLGISIQGRIFPKATQRNRVKRLIKEVFRRNKHNILSGYDILVKPKNIELADLKYQDVEERLLSLFREAKVWK